jgi:tRNA(fMet)-specific endonuclease VapC
VNPRYMLDTNICIYLMKRQPPAVAARFAACRQGDVVLSAITYAELEYGVVCSGDKAAANRAALEALVAVLPVAPFDAEAAGHYGDIRAATRERTRDALDKLIAAHARAAGCILITNNVRDFVGYPGLVVENWVEGV